MEALRSIPKVLDSLDQIRSNSDPADVLAAYKKNVKIFISSIKDEVAALINQY